MANEPCLSARLPHAQQRTLPVRPLRARLTLTRVPAAAASCSGIDSARKLVVHARQGKALQRQLLQAPVVLKETGKGTGESAAHVKAGPERAGKRRQAAHADGARLAPPERARVPPCMPAWLSHRRNGEARAARTTERECLRFSSTSSFFALASAFA